MCQAGHLREGQENIPESENLGAEWQGCAGLEKHIKYSCCDLLFKNLQYNTHALIDFF